MSYSAKSVWIAMALLLGGCKADVDSQEAADVEIPKLIAEYRKAVFEADKPKADELEEKVNGIIRYWQPQNSSCTVLAFQRSAQQNLVFAIPLDYLMQRTPRPDADEMERAMAGVGRALDPSEATAQDVDAKIESCRSMFNEHYSPADVAAIHAAFQPLHDIHRRAHAFFPPTLWKNAADERQRGLAEAAARQHLERAADKELADCVAAATSDPTATAKVDKAEIVAACKIMLK